MHTLPLRPAAETLTLRWSLTGAVCGPCGSTVADTDRACPACGTTAGPFRPRTATGHLTPDAVGGGWLTVHDTTGRLQRRRLSADAARRLARTTIPEVR